MPSGRVLVAAQSMHMDGNVLLEIESPLLKWSALIACKLGADNLALGSLARTHPLQASIQTSHLPAASLNSMPLPDVSGGANNSKLDPHSSGANCYFDKVTACDLQGLRLSICPSQVACGGSCQTLRLSTVRLEASGLRLLWQ